MAPDVVPELLPGDGFSAGALRSNAHCIIAGDEQLRLFDLGLGREERLEHGTGYNCPLAVDRERSLVYYSAGGIRRLDLSNRDWVEILDPPTVEDFKYTREERAKYEAFSSEKRAMCGPAYVWTLALSISSDELIALASGPVGGAALLVRHDLLKDEMECVRLDDWTAGMAVAPEAGILCLPNADDGPRILNLNGGEVASLRNSGGVAWGSRFVGGNESAVTADGGKVALTGRDAGVAVWVPRNAEFHTIDSFGMCPAWSPSGNVLYYMRGEREFWFKESDRLPRMLARIGSESETLGPDFIHGFATTPEPSPCGRYVYFQLCYRTDDQGAAHHVAGVADVQTNEIAFSRDRFFHNVAWLGSPEAERET